MSWPANPTNGQRAYINGITYEWNATDSVWNRMFASINIPDYTTAETVSFPAQPNITSTGTLSSLTVTGDSVISGNLTVTGTTEYFNTISMKIQDPVIELGGGANGAPLTTNDNRDRGIVLHYYSSVASKAVDAFMGWDISTSEFRFASNATIAGEVATFNTYGNVRGSYFFGNGSQLTGVIGNSNFAGYAGNVTEAAQPNITSVGTLIDTTMGPTNSLSGGNLVSATYLTGTLTTKVQPNITSVGTLINTTIGSANSLTGGNLLSANYVSGTLTTQSQPNITSVGTLINTTMGSANSLSGGNLVSATYLTGTLTTQSQPNITSVGTLIDTTIGASNSLSGGNLLSANYVTGTLTTRAQPNITSVGTLINTTMGSANSLSGGNLVSATYLTGTLTTSAQPNITSVGAMSLLDVSTINVDYLRPKTGSSIDVSGYADLTNVNGISFTANSNLSLSGSLSRVYGANFVGATYLSGTLTTGAQPNITSTGTLTALTVTGLVTATAGGIKVGNIQDPTGTNTISVSSGTVGIVGNLNVGTGGVGNISATNATINSGLAVTGGSTFALSSDRTTYVGSASSGAVNLDVAAAGPVWYFTSVSSSFVANFQNVPTTDGFTTVVSLAFVSSTVVPTVQIAGASQTIKWLYGAEPLGDAASTNFYTFTLMRVNSSWVVFGHQSLYA